MNLVDYEHWSFIIHFQDTLNFCKSGERDRAAASGYAGQGYKSTPTPFMSPTPTPQPSNIIDDVLALLSESNSIGFKITTVPDETPVISDEDIKSSSESLPSTLYNIIKNIEDAKYGSNSWINNISHKSIVGTVDSSLIDILIPNLLTNKTAVVTIWLTDDNALKRMQIKGALTESDTGQSTRTFDIE